MGDAVDRCLQPADQHDAHACAQQLRANDGHAAAPRGRPAGRARPEAAPSCTPSPTAISSLPATTTRAPYRRSRPRPGLRSRSASPTTRSLVTTGRGLSSSPTTSTAGSTPSTTRPARFCGKSLPRSRQRTSRHLRGRRASVRAGEHDSGDASSYLAVGRAAPGRRQRCGRAPRTRGLCSRCRHRTVFRSSHQ